MDTIIAAAMSNLLAFGYPACKDYDDDVKVSTTTQSKYSPAFFIVRISLKKSQNAPSKFLG